MDESKTTLKPSEILEDCIADIEAGRWICGELHIHDGSKGPNPRDMGCAIGLVSLNSGDTKRVKITTKELTEYNYETHKYETATDRKDVNISKDNGPFSGASAFIQTKEPIKVGDVFEVARYPKSGSPKSTKKAVGYLEQTIPMDPEDISRSSHGPSLNQSVSTVVAYNDDYCKTPAMAKKWFKAARDLAVKNGD